MANSDTPLDRRQLNAIARAADLGRLLQEEHPEVARLYLEGTTLPAIINQLDLPGKYGVTYEVAHTGVRYALGGFPGAVDRSSYDGLIPALDLQSLATKHISETSAERYRAKKGISGMDDRKKAAALKKAGEIRLAQIQEHGSSLDNRTPQEKAAAGRAGVIARGFVPWSGPETERLLELYKERPSDAVYAADVLNKEFHAGQGIRNSKHVSKKYNELRKKKNE